MGRIVDLRYHDCREENSWREYDARGIYLETVCTLCKKVKLSRYRKEVLTDSQYEVDEQIEEDG